MKQKILEKAKKQKEVDCSKCKYFDVGCQCERFMAAGCIPTKRTKELHWIWKKDAQQQEKEHEKIRGALAETCIKLNDEIEMWREIATKKGLELEERKQKLKQFTEYFGSFKVEGINSQGIKVTMSSHDALAIITDEFIKIFHEKEKAKP